MSSLKMTFSLTSLILIFALGLVFVPTAVMAHDNASGAADTPRPHTHPLVVTLDEKTTPATATDLGTEVTPHGVHPMVTSIVALPSSNTSVTAFNNQQVILLANDGMPADVTAANAGEFKVKVTFDRTLPTGEELTAGATFDSGTPANTAANEVVFRAFDKDNTEITSGITSVASGPLTAAGTEFELTIAVTGATHHDGTDSMLPIDVYIDIARDAVTGPVGRSGGTVLAAAGNDPYMSSEAMKFTIVSTLDTTAPTVTITSDTNDGVAPTAGVVTFTIASDQALGTDLTVDDITVTGGTKGAFTVVTAKEEWTLAVTPDALMDPPVPVMVTIAAADLADGFGNAPTADATASYTPPRPSDETAPTVTVAATTPSPSKMDSLTGGKVEFTITFSEALGTGFDNFTIQDVTITGGTAAATDLTGPAMTADDAQMPDVYTLMVTPDSADGTVTVTVGTQIADASRNQIDSTDTTNVFSDSVVLDSTPPTVLSHASSVLATPPTGAPAGTYLSFTLTFSEPVQQFAVDAIDQGNSHNAGFDTRYFGPVSGGTDAMLSSVWTITVATSDPDSVTSIQLRIGRDAVMDAAGNGLAVTYTAANTLANTRPYFVGTMPNIGICKGDDLGTTGYVLPLAADLDKPAQTLEYTITPALPEGLFEEPIDHQRRAIKGTTTVVGTTTHTWQVTDQYGLTAATPITFTITVKEHQKPEKPTGLMATKVDSASIEAPTQNRVRLTWPQAANKTAYPDCIPVVTAYTVSQTKKDEVTNTYPASSLMTYSSMTGQPYAENFVPPTGAGAWSFTTPMLDIGIYKFTIVAHNAAPSSPSVSSDAAVWDVTMEMEVVVANPPKAPTSLEGAIDQDGNQVTLNWLKVPDADDGGAPIDDFGVYKANTKYGGYVVYQVRDEDDQVTRYPATGTLEIDDYEHPTFQTPNLDPGQYVFRVTALNIAGESPRSLATREFTIVSSGQRPPVLPQPTVATYSNGVTSIGAGQMIAANGFYLIRANALPDIYRFFAEGGTISVLGATGAEAKSVVISEIMWGRNLRQAVGAGRKAEQFIELYNTSAATINLSTVTLVFDSTNAVPAAPTGKVLLDQVSNVSGIGWLITEAPGQDGSLAEPGDPNTFAPTNLVSMYRKITYANVIKRHNADDAAKNREEQLKAIPDGNAIGNWAASNDADTYGINRIGSPGAQHFVPYVKLTKTEVKRDMFIINEIGNYTDDKYDWVEIKRVGSADNLKNWRLSQIHETEKKDIALVTFPNNDNHKIPNENDLLLIVNTDPYQDPDHPLAAGDRINGGHDLPTGIKSRYYVDSGLKLANSGKTLLILRNNHEDKNLGTANNIQDVIGTLGITNNTAAFRTNLWPLIATGAPDGDVVKDADEDLRAGKVYTRNAGGGTGKHHIFVAGYTGVGYKRSAASSGQHGGTPGYDNGAVKVNETDLADNATVSISEIMYTKDRSLPQWIELYNSSHTQAINLAEWKLRIEHSRDADDVDIRVPSVTTNNLGGIIIQPNQTVLIVSDTIGRTSRAAQGGIDFPATRIINLWGQKDKLEVVGATRRTYKLLSATAFKITLLDKGNSAVDIAGNLGDDGTAMWELPSNGDEGRSSIIRRYNTGDATSGGNGMAEDGTMREGWVYAADSALSHVRFNETYYGSPDDIGTPGFRAGGPLPVSLSKFRPERLKDTGEVVVHWITESELNNAGFNILRSEKRDGEFTKVHFQAGKGTTSERSVYEWKDQSAKPNVVYYYQIQDVSLDGDVTTLRVTHLRGNVTAAGKLTTMWGEIKALQ